MVWDLQAVTEALSEAGCVAADEEAVELLEAAAGDQARLAELVSRRRQGEPLAWLVGSVVFCDVRVIVHPGVYVPRWQTAAIARAGLAGLPERGRAVDLCTGSGAVAAVLGHHRPDALVAGTETDPAAIACAVANGVRVWVGDIADGVPASWDGTVDVVTGVVPYVPTSELEYLPRDVLAYEPRAALDGGPDGLRLLPRAVAAAARLLRPGGFLVLELGGSEAELLIPVLVSAKFGRIERLVDEDGDLRGVTALAT